MDAIGNYSRAMSETIDILQQAQLGTLDDYEIAYESPGQKSVVLFSKAKSNEVIKIPIPSHDFAKQGFLSEVQNLNRFNALGISSLDIPVITKVGKDPDYIIMTRLGPILANTWETMGGNQEREIKAIGRAVGEFVLEVHQKTGGLIHCDIHFQQLTRQSNNRYGCLDFEYCEPGDIETAFVKLSFERPNVIPAASERIRELTGTRLNAEKLRQESLNWVRKYWGERSEVIRNIEQNCDEVAAAGNPSRTANFRPPNRKLGMKF